MTTTTRKYTSALQIRHLLGIPLVTTIVLLIVSMAFHTPGMPLISSAHAAAAGEKIVTQNRLQTPCATDPTGPHCNNQDPIIQGCNRDAQTLSFKDIPDKQGTLLATVQRRYSPTCHSEWGRIVESPNNHQPIGISIGNNASQVTAGPIAFTMMVFVPNMSIASRIKGTVSVNGIAPDQNGGAGLEVTLSALPTTPQ